MKSITDDIKYANILIVDDNQANVSLLENILEEEDYCNITSLTDPREVLETCVKNKFDLILLDMRMPFMTGIDVMNSLKSITVDDYLPIIVLTAQTDVETRQDALTAGAKDFITKPFQDWEIILRIKNMLETRYYFVRQLTRADILENEVKKRTQEIYNTQIEIVNRLAAAGEYRDNETGMHVVRMSYMCQRLAQELGMREEQADLIKIASTMHDVGKIGIPDHVLLKAGKLTDDEWEIMKTHPKIGEKILGTHNSDILNLARQIAVAHHEKWDGRGYPSQLSGEDIPTAARIVSICDVYDALRSERPYKKSWPIEECMQLINNESGRHFEPIVVEKFVNIAEEIENIRTRYRD